MKSTIVNLTLIFALSFIACNRQDNTNSVQQDTATTNPPENMKHTISIVEIPTADFTRAVAFYEAILGITIEVSEMDGIKMGAFPTTDDGVFVQLINGSDYKPSADGTIIYLSGGHDLLDVSNKI
jgi:predicted enzyme related to lactoylglutathione lyase